MKMLIKLIVLHVEKAPLLFNTKDNPLLIYKSVLTCFGRNQVNYMKDKTQFYIKPWFNS